MDLHEPRASTGKTNGAGQDRTTGHHTMPQTFQSPKNFRGATSTGWEQQRRSKVPYTGDLGVGGIVKIRLSQAAVDYCL